MPQRHPDMVPVNEPAKYLFKPFTKLSDQALHAQAHSFVIR